MAIDIHWVFERRHANGDWVAVFSDIRLKEMLLSRAPDTEDFTASIELARRNNPWFSRLSGYSDENEEEPILAPGMPGDAALYTRDFLDGNRASMQGFKALRPVPFERHGAITLGEVRAGAAAVEPGQNPALIVSGNAPRAHYLRRLLAHFERITPRLEEEILFGRVHFGREIEHPDMDAASNHQRIDAIALRDGLLPLRDDTLRWIVAYGY